MATVAELLAEKTQALTEAYNTEIKSLITPVYNVRGYGATGDGATDDTAAIQTAIDLAEAAGGGIVFCPPGTYISTKLTVSEPNIILDGVRSASTIKLKANTDTYLFHAESTADYCALRNLKFDGNRSNQALSTPGLTRSDIIGMVADADNFAMKFCEVKSFSGGAGLQLSGDYYRVKHNKFQDMGTIKGDILRSCDCIHVGGATDTGLYGEIVHNLLMNYTDYGVAIDYAYKVVVDSNIILMTPVYAYSGAYGIGGAYGAKHISVKNNKIYANSKLDSGIDPTFATGDGNGRWIIRNNEIYDTLYACVVLREDNVVAGSIIEHNYLYNGQYAINFDAQGAYSHKIGYNKFDSMRDGLFAYDSTQKLSSDFYDNEVVSDRSNIIARGTVNVSPFFETTADWTINGGTPGGAFVTGGDQLFANGNAWQLSGNGADASIGFLSQTVATNGRMITTMRYTLTVCAKLTGRTAGKLKVHLIGTGVDTFGVELAENTADFVKLTTVFTLSSVPSDLYINVGAEDTPNNGFVCRVAAVYLKEGVDNTIR